MRGRRLPAGKTPLYRIVIRRADLGESLTRAMCEARRLYEVTPWADRGGATTLESLGPKEDHTTAAGLASRAYTRGGSVNQRIAADPRRQTSTADSTKMTASSGRRTPFGTSPSIRPPMKL